jgi:DNA-binding HxlR family transcriptional regulator
MSDALEAALARVGDRWSLLIVQALLDGPRRFNELLADVPGLASNILSQRLRHLEAQAVVVAVPYSERPPRFTYELTAAGTELAGALRLLSHWGAQGAEGPRHTACGTSLEARWHCPTCDRPVDDAEGEGLEYA